MPAPATRRLATLLAFAIFSAPHAAANAQAAAELARELPSERRKAMLFVAPLLSAGWSQTLGAPKAWKRTWGGYGSRAGDLYGFLVVRTSVRYVVDRAVPWVDDRSPCLSQPVFWGREVVIRAGCALTRTTTLRTSDGNLRPNLPLLTGLTVGTATSLSWRPERRSAVSSRAFVAQRLAISYGATVLVRLVKDWRADAKGALSRR
ncbi:hypothetical protein [Gemmatimonas sp.]|uniref:hypothetical protein n=1 Tax=Gemmatimonas sp. TaxID=1962908 RepID=UPI00356A02C9